HGVIKRIAPQVEILDITHGIPPRAVLQGALVLANTLSYMPVGVPLAVVDPGVGGGTRAVALRDGEGRIYVGPDNGLLVPAADSHGGIAEVHELTNPEYALPSVSRTFHGRDLFAPAAAHLALGVPLAELGPSVDPAGLERLDIPRPEVGDGKLRVKVLYVDRYGNVQVSATADDLAAAGMEEGARVELDVGFESYFATVAGTFADVRNGDILLYEDSYWNVALAINGGNAAETLAVRPGADLRVRRAT
ncbi:MAG TPA: SAM-dependent chlorinase/fluorinase, partial [Gaiellaceae bacterium]|nr:SAM-dependent chlorinase/fluorinase [Gaiellaceae bacterium]